MTRYKIPLLTGLFIAGFACKTDSLLMGNNPVDSGNGQPGHGGQAGVQGLGGQAGIQDVGGSTGVQATGGSTSVQGSGGSAGIVGHGGVPAGGAGAGGSVTTSTIPMSRCGNGVLEPGEQCDDGNILSGDGCSSNCQLEDPIDPCLSHPSLCVIATVCGDSRVTSNEICDDGNTVAGDGCSPDCRTVEPGWTCRVPGKRCTPACGDGMVVGSETCDDGNTIGGDGCSSTCQIEPGAACLVPGQPCRFSVCGNGVVEAGEQCDLGSKNGLFYGNGKGCSKTCTMEPTCRDSSGKTQACTTACGDGNIDPGEECDDGNQVNGDGCSSTCKIEVGFTCSTVTAQASSTCQSGAGQCLDLSMIYRDFQPENVASGGHPDFFFLGTKAGGSKSPTTICVPNSAGPSHGNDSTARCWGIVAPTLLGGKPQPGSTTTCACQFSDWNINSSHIPGTGYTEAGNDSPLSDGNGGYLGASAGTTFTVAGNAGNSVGSVTCYNSNVANCAGGGPIWKGTVPAFKDADSFKQWFNDDPSVNKTFTGVLEMPSIGTNIYQYASASHFAQGGFFPLDTLNPSQATLCNLWPYWNHGDGTPIWSTCQGDQYLFPPRIVPGDCGSGVGIADGCWISNVAGVKHDSYFTDEARYYFVYDGAAGFSLSFFGDDDLFVFINGNLVLDLGGVHQQLPGKITVTGSPGDATVTEGGCLDTAGNITGASAGSNACTPANATAPTATTPDDFRVHTVKLGLITGKVYEIAIFGADRHPPESNFQLTLNGFTTMKSICKPMCGDGIVSGGEECDCGDGTGALPSGCSGPNDDTTYGGCTTQCKFGPFCGDGMVNGPEECDNGQSNGTSNGQGGCTISCTKPHYCGDGIVDAYLGEECDLGSLNGQTYCTSSCQMLVH